MGLLMRGLKENTTASIYKLGWKWLVYKRRFEYPLINQIEDHFASRQSRGLPLTSPLTNEEIEIPELARLIPNLTLLPQGNQRADLIE